METKKFRPPHHAFVFTRFIIKHNKSYLPFIYISFIPVTFLYYPFPAFLNYVSFSGFNILALVALTTLTNTQSEGM